MRRFIENALPWYDPAFEARHDERSQFIEQESLAVARNTEYVVQAGRQRIREAYQLVERRLDKR